MPWNEVRPVDERGRFVSEFLLGDRTMSELCRVFGISRKTGYKWLSRFASCGVSGLAERSRAPLHRPNVTPREVTDALVEERLRRPHWGPKKLVKALRRDRGLDAPAPSTAGSILKREGLIAPRRRRRPVTVRSWPNSLTVASRPNQVWATDFKGQFRTGDGKKCYPLTVSDLCSRYVLGCDALSGPRHEPTRESFERLFSAHGLPEVIRVDNGTPFSGRGVLGLSRLSVFWLLQGVSVEFIQPGKPQQNGCHERMHRTLKAETTRPPAANMAAQQDRFEAWREEFNHARPHEGLSMRCPADVYEPSKRVYEGREDFSYPPDMETRRPRANGCMKWQRKDVYVGDAFAWITLGIRPTAGDGWLVYAGDTALGEIDTATGGLRPLSPKE